jgi:hypothetical protein
MFPGVSFFSVDISSDCFYSAYLECLECCFHLLSKNYLTIFSNKELNEIQKLKLLDQEINSILNDFDSNVYIKTIDKLERLNLFCLMVYEK